MFYVQVDQRCSEWGQHEGTAVYGPFRTEEAAKEYARSWEDGELACSWCRVHTSVYSADMDEIEDVICP